MARRDFGTIRKLGSGRHQARYVGPDDERRTLGTYATKKEAQDALAALRTDIREPGAAWLPPGVDPEHDEKTRVDKFISSTGSRRGAPWFGKFAAEILAQRAQAGELAPRTAEGYESLLRRHLEPVFGQLPLDMITVRRVDDWWAAMAGEGKVTRRNAYFVLSGVMRYAVRYGHIPVSPCPAKSGRGEKVSKPRPYLEVSEFERIVSNAPASLYAPLWVAYGAHLRLGELVGLNRGDVDPETGSITIDKQAQQVRGGLVIRETKTGNRRTIKLLEPGRVALAAYLAGNDEPADAPLFRGPKGGRLSRGYVSSQWVKAREAAGLPNAHFHDSRHTSLTGIAPYASTAEVMARAGHTSVQASMQYQHATADRDAVVADAASAALTEQLAKTAHS